MSRTLRHFSLFILISLFLHLGVFLYFATAGKKSALSEPTATPFFVDLREPKLKPRELDLPLREQSTPRIQPARRLAADDLVAEREQAPKGNDWRDTAFAPVIEPSTTLVPKQREHEVPPSSDKGIIPTLSREALLHASENAAQNIADLDPELNRRMQRDVEEGKAVWLDTEKDILGSFYKRFRDAVEGVWGYPLEAIARGESGVCLYRIEINRAGVLINEPELLRSSGSKRLDDEAAQAVAKASPRFGFLPDAYRYETLTIFAYFEYQLGSSRPTLRGASYYR